jgi:hypothetical protein
MAYSDIFPVYSDIFPVYLTFSRWFPQSDKTFLMTELR